MKHQRVRDLRDQFSCTVQGRSQKDLPRFMQRAAVSLQATPTEWDRSMLHRSVTCSTTSAYNFVGQIGSHWAYDAHAKP